MIKQNFGSKKEIVPIIKNFSNLSPVLLLNMENILNTAHIHLDHAIFRVHVRDSAAFNIHMMNEDENRPPYIMWVSRSNDPEQTKKSILVAASDGYELPEIAEWINKYDV